MRFKKTKWGWWFVLLDRASFKVKLLKFYKDRKCSMQKHDFRKELWLFLSGDGTMARINHPHSDKKREGSFYHIPIGQYHQYIAAKPTLVLEIQYGSKCDENDIFRL